MSSRITAEWSGHIHADESLTGTRAILHSGQLPGRELHMLFSERIEHLVTDARADRSVADGGLGAWQLAASVSYTISFSPTGANARTAPGTSDRWSGGATITVTRLREPGDGARTTVAPPRAGTVRHPSRLRLRVRPLTRSSR